ncbi:acyl-CoA dehydrogenase family protein [Cellulomonas carbonis]|uniref:Monooxygenase n=1 Tax=Cellulomonas carbonis T26 TaxID=947969 RepID=A0A0A0BLG6_9CELL|nr:acyl-CoA dehydrogenase family protein [Cellulomonas carbonis]KGM09363.1 monooxygenase [Cellulomonas carbonis T26]GGC16177.1 acyl-CoA dehydrogenase [Cellulomonas carbonis]
MTGTRYDAAVEKYRPVLERIAARAVDAELTRTLPFEQVEWLRAAGFGAARIPVELGGDGLTWAELTRLLVDLATADSNVVQALRGHFALVEDQLYHHPREDRSAWLRRFAAGELAGNAWTEPGAGGVATVLDGSGDDLTLTGRKFYTTGSIFADWIDAVAKRPDGSDVAVIVRARQDGVTILDDWDGFGQRLTGTGTTIFDGARVEPDAVFEFESRFRYQTALYQHFHLATLAGIAHAAARDAADQVRSRTRAFTHNNATLVRHDPQALATVGQIGSVAYVATATALRAADAIDAAYAARDLDADAEHAVNVRTELETAQAQVVLSTLVPQAVGSIFDALGASSTSTAKALDRHWRNARTVATHNPWTLKAKVVGDHAVNGTEPVFVWGIGVQAPADAASSGAGSQPVRV